MALYTFDEIKAQVLEEINNYDLANSQYPEDRLSEMADSAVPIYYSDILDEWREMPMEYSNRFQEIGVDDDFTITQLMQIDLGIYYSEQFYQAFQELTETESE